MADPLGVTASIIAIVQITKEIVALAKKNIHTSEHAHSVLSSLLDAIRLSAMNHVGGPLEACKESLSFLKDALERRRGKLWIGKVLDSDITKALDKLDQLRPILQIALAADQRVLSAAIESYAKSISEDLHKLQRTTEDIQGTVQSSFKQAVSAKKEAEDLVKRQNILDWISTLDQTGRYQILIDSHHKGTSEWFMQSRDYTEWSSAKFTNLWLFGTVGSGKSVHSAVVIQHVQLARKGLLNARGAFGYYYFDANDNDDRSITGFLRSLIKQLSTAVKTPTQSSKSI
ncbi:hypothetical protein ACJ41O_001574 [Fusarium nematophilum]